MFLRALTCTLVCCFALQATDTQLNIECINLHTPTNRSFKIQINDQTIFFRIGNNTPELFGINRQREIESLKIASDLGITPRLLGYELNNGLLMLEFIRGWTPTIEDLPHLINDVVNNFHLLHACKQNHPVELTMFDKCRHWKKGLDSLGLNQDPKTLDFWFSVMDSFETGYYDNEETALCHGDVWFGNILVSENSKVYFIDWEYSFYGYAIDDLGKFGADLPNPHDLERFATAYWGPKAPEKMLKLQQNIFLHTIAFYLWCPMQAHNDPANATTYLQTMHKLKPQLNAMAAQLSRLL